jgi:hypothetical protein
MVVDELSPENKLPLPRSKLAMDKSGLELTETVGAGDGVETLTALRTTADEQEEQDMFNDLMKMRKRNLINLINYFFLFLRLKSYV